MADPLYHLLVAPDSAAATAYLNHLQALDLASLCDTEPQSLAQQQASTNRSLQALSKRSHKSIIASSQRLADLSTALPDLQRATAALHHALPELETASAAFEQRYSRSADNAVLDRRRKAMLVARNIDRVADVLELPTLLSSAIAAGAPAQGSAAAMTATTSTANYTAALDLQAHIKRLRTLYPAVGLVDDIAKQADAEMKAMATNLVASLQGPGIKLAGAMRTVGWLRRVAPELDEGWSGGSGGGYSRRGGGGAGAGKGAAANAEGALGALFLVCRLANLLSTLEALEPLRELADQESAKRAAGGGGGAARTPWAGGQQTERYLKRYIELFREQSFAIVSMYKSIFPSALPAPGSSDEGGAGADAGDGADEPDNLQPLPSALASFPLHLVELLAETLRAYMPNVRERASRDSLLTQVLYCANSLGRLGGDFGMVLALLAEELQEEGEGGEGEGEDDEEEEWVEVMKKHRVQASRLELLASGVGAGRTAQAAG
ncbi:uncharacterized protein K452DRAFT_233911 [Aplosporella prunicola CBS 121167]|uniref:Conserved oligomeric Golgi complex subunit 8 n=1 Tax=Aplosporella prunicola CBS 121167 TaxID=1176127 RepID=A0A6A6B307_9PEZI|nr:uncharacterized protein K452DRAFT_233911 [Aplosporella prunicola CBS 121167]KAF2138569.1 hypothetical protein K452DRAFT_233911 [Aplosporella prunicola CBS 121167]